MARTLQLLCNFGYTQTNSTHNSLQGSSMSSAYCSHYSWTTVHSCLYCTYNSTLPARTQQACQDLPHLPRPKNARLEATDHIAALPARKALSPAPCQMNLISSKPSSFSGMVKFANACSWQQIQIVVILGKAYHRTLTQ